MNLVVYLTWRVIITAIQHYNLTLFHTIMVCSAHCYYQLTVYLTWCVYQTASLFCYFALLCTSHHVFSPVPHYHLTVYPHMVYSAHCIIWLCTLHGVFSTLCHYHLTVYLKWHVYTLHHFHWKLCTAHGLFNTFPVLCIRLNYHNRLHHSLITPP